MNSRNGEFEEKLRNLLRKIVPSLREDELAKAVPVIAGVADSWLHSPPGQRARVLEAKTSQAIEELRSFLSPAYQSVDPLLRRGLIYELRTYTLRPGTMAEFEERYSKRLPLRERHSKLGAFWHTEVGPLNQVIHVYPYESLEQRTAVRDAMAKDTALAQLPSGREFIVEQEAEIVTPAPFMHPLGGRDFGTGNVYEMRTYTFAPGDIPKVLDAWGKAIEMREKYSPLAACWTTEIGGLNKFVHTWVYKDLNERVRIRAESRKAGGWPPQTGVRPIRQENKILIPAPFSPVR